MNVSQQYEEPAHHTIQLPANVAPKIYAQSIITRRESRRKEERKENEDRGGGSSQKVKRLINIHDIFMIDIHDIHDR